MAEPIVNYTVNPVESLQGDIKLPGDKSISHRALLLASIAEGRTTIHNLLMGADNVATLTALRALGVVINLAANHAENNLPSKLNFMQFSRENTAIKTSEKNSKTSEKNSKTSKTSEKASERISEKNALLTIDGNGLEGLRAPTQVLDLGNSGTGFRLMTGLLAAQSFDSEITGDESLCRRPMARIVNPLMQMGAKITMTAKNTAPLLIQGGQKLQGIRYAMSIASAQVKASLLLAGLYANGMTTVIEPAKTRDHTERMLQQFHYPIIQQNNESSVSGKHPLRATEIWVPGDISSAAFFIVAALITPRSEIRLRGVGINPSRIGILNILREMGGNIELENIQSHPEPIADIIVRHSRLHGITIPPEQVPLAIDEFPIIFIAAACAKGQTLLHGAEELRVKESDRIASMAEGLARVGIKTNVFPDGMLIEGGVIAGGTIDSFGDHRIAMAFAVAANVAQKEIKIQNCANVATSFPNFIELAQAVGMDLSVTHE